MSKAKQQENTQDPEAKADALIVATYEAFKKACEARAALAVERKDAQVEEELAGAPKDYKLRGFGKQPVFYGKLPLVALGDPAQLAREIKDAFLKEYRLRSEF